MVRETHLVVKNLKKSYQKMSGGILEAVRDISFEVRSGECFGLLGPNGAGKSTAINCTIGFYPPTAGTVTICGSDVHREPKVARKQLGVCPQEDTLDTDFSVRDQLVRHAAFFKLAPKQRQVRADELLERFRLKDQAKEMVDALSGGMRRKLQVARALISHPKVLILDEPTTGLDPDARRQLWEVLVEERQNGTAILLSTHYMDEAERLCDRIALLDHGKILDLQSPEKLIKDHAGEIPIEEEVRPGVIWKRQPNLEDVFMKLTGSKLGEGALR